MLSALSSLRFFVFSPPSVPSNLSALSVDQLNRLRDSLVPFRDADLSIIVWATVLVTIGVLMEVAEIQHDVREAARELKGQNKLGELKPILKLVVAVGWMLVALGLGLEWWGDARINSVSTDLDTVNQALVHRAEDDAINAGTSAHNAGFDATTARDAARDAQNDAKGAHREADSLTQEIVDAKQQSADASSKAADAVSRLAGAEQLLADATQREANAEGELKRLKTPRSLSNIDSLVTSLKPFKGTEYILSVAQDDDAFQLTRDIDKALNSAGWIRKQPTSHAIGIPYFNILSKNFADAVPACVATGVVINVKERESLESLKSRPPQFLPEIVRAALALSDALGGSILPSDEHNVDNVLIDPSEGEEGPMSVCVGKKP